MLRSKHRTLARTLAYIGLHSAGDFGLFWNPDGTMPWKEFYWALQEDPELRFVREATIRELSLLGIDLPFALDGNFLRLVPGISSPSYEIASDLPERLYFGLRPKNLVHVQKFGLSAASRPYVTLCSERDLALRIARRRESDPLMIEIMARKAQSSGVTFLAAGPLLYLAADIPKEFLLLPPIRLEILEKMIEKRTRPAPKQVPPPTPGSFTVQPHHFPQSDSPGGGNQPKHGTRRRKGGWKEDSRKERDKRKV